MRSGSRTAYEELLQEAGEAYGRSNAEHLFADHLTWQEIANDIFLPEHPEWRLGVGFSENPWHTTEGGGYRQQTGVMLDLPQKLSAEVFTRVPHFWIHEISHAARQKAANERHWDNDPRTIFNLVIDEGVATYMECGLLGTSIAVTYGHRSNMPEQQLTKVPDLLDQLLSGETLKGMGKVTAKAAHDYMYGPPGFRARGYKLGHYIVSAVAEMSSLMLDDVLTLPNVEYRQSIQELLA